MLLHLCEHDKTLMWYTMMVKRHGEGGRKDSVTAVILHLPSSPWINNSDLSGNWFGCILLTEISDFYDFFFSAESSPDSRGSGEDSFSKVSLSLACFIPGQLTQVYLAHYSDCQSIRLEGVYFNCLDRSLIHNPWVNFLPGLVT